MENRALYDVLNVREDASTADIRRAYRRLSAVFHPDKQQDELLKEEAASSFTTIKDAYEILTDENKRRIYDLFGHDGLQAGIEFSAADVDQEEMREQWERFKGSLYLREVHMQAAPRTLVELKVDARKTFKQLINGIIPPVWPVIIDASLSADVNFQYMDKFVFKSGCQIKMVRASRKGPHAEEDEKGDFSMEGDLRLPCSLQFQASERDTLQLDGNFGRQQQVVALSSQRILTQRDTGSIAATFSPDGLGLQASLARQLHNTLRAELLWVLGPPDDSGITLTCAHTSDKWSVSGKMQLGSATVLRGIAAYKVQQGTSLISIANLGTTGIFAELGVRQQWGESITTSVSVQHGLMGSSIKLRLVRAGHTLSVPIFVSDRYQDWQTLLMAMAAPVALNLLISWLVVQPLKYIHRSLKSAEGDRALQQNIARAKVTALKQQDLIMAAVLQQVAEEDRKGGLVMIRAAYGNTEGYRKRLDRQAAMFAAHTGQDSASRESPEHPGVPQDDWLDVTIAMQFLVVDSQVVLRERNSREYLMGFADLKTKGGDKLYVLYKWQDRYFELDVQGCQETIIPSDAAVEMFGERASFAQHLLQD